MIFVGNHYFGVGAKYSIQDSRKLIQNNIILHLFTSELVVQLCVYFTWNRVTCDNFFLLFLWLIYNFWKDDFRGRSPNLWTRNGFLPVIHRRTSGKRPWWPSSLSIWWQIPRWSSRIRLLSCTGTFEKDFLLFVPQNRGRNLPLLSRGLMVAVVLCRWGRIVSPVGSEHPRRSTSYLGS